MITPFSEPIYHVIVRILPGAKYYDDILEKQMYMALPAYGFNELNELVYPHPLTGVLMSTVDNDELVEFVRVSDSSAIYAEMQISVYEATNGKDDDNNEDDESGLFGGLLWNNVETPRFNANII